MFLRFGLVAYLLFLFLNGAITAVVSIQYACIPALDIMFFPSRVRLGS